MSNQVLFAKTVLPEGDDIRTCLWLEAHQREVRGEELLSIFIQNAHSSLDFFGPLNLKGKSTWFHY